MARPALIIAHPGHELRVHHWLEREQPLVFVLTDGSGSAGHSRVPSTLQVLGTAGARPGAVMGAFSDEKLYRAIMTGELDEMTRVTMEIAQALIDHEIDVVVADSCEFYNPAHDLCRAVANLAVELAQQATGAVIESYDYAVVGTPDANGIDGEQVIHLDDAALQRKYDAAMHYPEMRRDLEIALRLDKLDAFRVEALRPVAATDDLPRPEGRPFYERAGEEHVAAGRFATVLRHDEHFVPFVSALAANVRSVQIPT